ncbi:MAG: histidine utilization repressor [Deltaproteobacteria bacterium]|nr:histidine utilization repressor [Deltaproteobacteria bacterium]MBW2082408.1 histidine utilization repressor [Deltaproteobacteria bacterium]
MDDFEIVGASARPLYGRVKDYILKGIEDGEWKPGEKIPSESELVSILGVSRMTVNRALRELSSEGRLTRVQGVGTFVNEYRPQTGFLEVKSIAREIRESGGVHSSKVLLLREERAKKNLAQLMGIPEGSPVFHSILLHLDRGRPVQYADRFVNPAVAPDYPKQDFTKITPSEYLLSVAPVTEVEHVVEAVVPDKNIRSLLKIGKGEPCLLLHRITWSHHIVATKNRFIYAGSRFRIGGRFRFSAPDGRHLGIA